MKKNSNAGWWWVFAILVIVLIVVIATHAKKSDDTGMYGSTGDTSSLANDTTGMESTEDTSAGSVTASTGTPTASLTYSQALNQYKDNRVQFDTSCQATPNAATYKNGTNIMLDNRSATPRTLHLGTLGDISIKAWGFKIVNLMSSLLPNAVVVDCGTSQNVAILTIQK